MIDVDSDAALMATRLMEDTQSSSGDAFLREEMRHRFFFVCFFYGCCSIFSARYCRLFWLKTG